MKYFGTSFSLTLGAWRLRVRIDLDDEPDERIVHSLAVASDRERVTSK